MRTLLLISVLTVCTAGMARADLFQNSIETWSEYRWKRIDNSTFADSHLLSNSTPGPVDILGGDVATGAQLALGFVDDEGDHDRSGRTECAVAGLDGRSPTHPREADGGICSVPALDALTGLLGLGAAGVALRRFAREASG